MVANCVKTTVNFELFLAVKYQIYAFLYFMRILPENCFDLDGFTAETVDAEHVICALTTATFLDEHVTLRKWFSDINYLIQKKKIQTLILNCYVPGSEKPVKQLVIDFFDSEVVSLHHNIKHTVETNTKDYLSVLIKSYKSCNIDKKFYMIDGGTINMIFVYKKKLATATRYKSEKLTENGNVLQKLEFHIQNKNNHYRICSRIKTQETKERAENPGEFTNKKKRRLIGLAKKDNANLKNSYAYSDIEESEIEENSFVDDNTTNIAKCSSFYSHF